MGRTEDFPWLTTALLVSYAAVAHFVTGWVPTEASIRPVAFGRDALREGRLLTVVWSLFAHGGIIHLLGNGLTLLGIGPTFERELGRVRFLLVYFGAGIIGNFAHVTFQEMPVVGASGCIFGLLGLMLVLDPGSELNLLGIPITVVVFAALYAAAAPLLIRMEDVLPIAHEAHLGGMLFGTVFAFTVNPRRAAWFVPGILLTFWAIQELLVVAIKFPWKRGLDDPILFLVFVPGILVWIAGGAYIAWVYRERVHRRAPQA